MSDYSPKLYKYMPPERASSVLEKLLIRFSQVSVMNDIEEFKPPIEGLASEAVFEQKFRERAEARYPGLMELVEKQGPEYMAKLRKQGEQNLPQTIQTIYEMNDKNFGILSLSEDPASDLMWEKYAGQGRGFLAEFDPSHSWFLQKVAEDDDLRHLRGSPMLQTALLPIFLHSPRRTICTQRKPSGLTRRNGGSFLTSAVRRRKSGRTIPGLTFFSLQFRRTAW